MLIPEYLNNLTIKNYIIKLKQNKFRAKSGVYAKVFSKANTDYVIKVGYTKKNINYLNYINKAKNYNFCPKIYYLYKNTQFFVIIMEKLTPINKLNNIKKQYVLNKLNVEYTYEISYVPYKHGFKQYYKIIEQLDPDNMLRDIHDDNIMIRKNMQLVITDPLIG